MGVDVRRWGCPLLFLVNARFQAKTFFLERSFSGSRHGPLGQGAERHCTRDTQRNGVGVLMIDPVRAVRPPEQRQWVDTRLLAGNRWGTIRVLDMSRQAGARGVRPSASRRDALGAR